MTKLAAAGLVALTLVSYRSVFTAAWVFEDTATMSYATRAATTQTWHIIRDPLGAHLLSLSLFLLLAALTLVLAQRLGVGVYGMWAIAVLILLHPINVESVAYAASRGELLAAIFIVGACIFATYGWWTAAGFGIVVCLSAAVISKESGVVGLLVVPLVATRFQRPTWLAWWLFLWR